jgi:hypothetical protein
MASLTRRTLLQQASIGAAAVGALTGPGVIANALPEAQAAGLPAEAFHGHLVAPVRHAGTGEIALHSQCRLAPRQVGTPEHPGAGHAWRPPRRIHA